MDGMPWIDGILQLLLPLSGSAEAGVNKMKYTAREK